MRARFLSVALIALGVGLISAAECSSGLETLLEGDERATIATAAGVATDVGASAMQMRLYECGASEPQKVARAPLRAGALDELPAAYGSTVEFEPSHAFGQRHFEIEEGCYRVEATPVDAADGRIDGCEPAETPNIFIGAGQKERYQMAVTCEDERAEAVTVDGRRNQPPTMLDVEVDHRDGEECRAAQVCASARDRDGDPIAMNWEARTESGTHLRLPEPDSNGSPGRLIECLDLEPSDEPLDITVTAFDRTETSSGREINREDAFMGEYDLIARSRDTAEARIEPDCSAGTCPDDRSERISDITYWITRDGELLEPTDDLGQVQPGDMVDVQFEVASGCEEVPVTFASYEAERDGEDRWRRERIASQFHRAYGPGAHLLWTVVPDCAFVVDLYQDSPMNASSKASDDPPYASELLDSKASAGPACSDSGR
ncbi:MAG: hypothetical protein ACOCV2_12895 [Persicimonas sp.]